LVSTSASAIELRGAGTAKAIQAAAARSAERLARLMPRRTAHGFSASSATIPTEYLGKTFVYSGGSYTVSALTGAPATGVRFLLYAVDPITLLPAEPLNQTGYVDLMDMSSGTTSSARVIVVSGGITYVDYRVNVSPTLTGVRVVVLGFISDGINEAMFNLRSVLTSASGLTLTYSIDVPERDLSVDLTLGATGTTPENSNISVTMDLRGQNGWVRLTGAFTATGGTLNVAINGTPFATITSTAGAETVITGVSGQPLTPEELETLQLIFEFTGGAFIAFDQLLAPVGGFIADI
jgi:hypothetical protein